MVYHLLCTIDESCYLRDVNMDYDLILPRIDRREDESRFFTIKKLNANAPLFDSKLKEEAFGLHLMVGKAQIERSYLFNHDIKNNRELIEELLFHKYRGVSKSLLCSGDDRVAVIRKLALLEIEYSAILIKGKSGYSTPQYLLRDMLDLQSSYLVSALYSDLADTCGSIKCLVSTCLLLQYSVESYFTINYFK